MAIGALRADDPRSSERLSPSAVTKSPVVAKERCGSEGCGVPPSRPNCTVRTPSYDGMGRGARDRARRSHRSLPEGGDNRDVRFGLFLPPFEAFAAPRRVAELAHSAEQAGWDGLFLWDHMLAIPGMAVADPWVTLAAVATGTTRLRFGALVTPLARRRPWVLARQIATLDRLSEGRLVAGIGLGDDGWAEFSAFGEETDPVVRAEILDEALVLLRQLLDGERVDHDGRHFAVHAPPLLPTPTQQPFPLWGACRWPSVKPLARSASLQGCFPIFAGDGPPPPPDPGDIAAIKRILVAHGADPDIDLVVRFSLSLQDPAEVPRTLDALARAGVTWVLEGFGPGQPPPDIVEEIVRRGPPHT